MAGILEKNESGSDLKCGVELMMGQEEKEEVDINI